MRATPVRSRPRWQAAAETAIELAIRLCGISAIVFVFGIFFFVFREGAPYLPELDVSSFLFGTDWYPSSDEPRFGVGALVVGTLSVTALSMVIAVPFGLGAAVYVSEFCAPRTRETL